VRPVTAGGVTGTPRRHPIVQSMITSSGLAPTRIGRPEVPMPRDTYIGVAPSRYQPAT